MNIVLGRIKQKQTKIEALLGLIMLSVIFSIFLFEAQPTGAATSKYDYGWLLKKTAYQIVTEPKFRSLVANVVPDRKVTVSSSPTNLRAVVRDYLSMPEGDSQKTIKDGRYVSIQGSKSHQDSSKCLMWIDVKTDESIVAISEEQDDFDHCFVIFTSKNFKAQAQFPSEFKNTYQAWLKQQNRVVNETALNSYDLL